MNVPQRYNRGMHNLIPLYGLYLRYGISKV
jgi:hypothetical protein